ncbi:MAG: hypothetical protein WBW88_02480, partial [Rhodothermales bacterium]
MMKTLTARTKSALLIVATLIIGAVIGALVHARITDQRFDRLAAMRSHRGFARLIERSVEFENPEQREAVLDIVDAASTRLFENMQRTRRETAEILDSTREQLSHVLSPDQMEQLEKRLMRHRSEQMRRRSRDM